MSSSRIRLSAAVAGLALLALIGPNAPRGEDVQKNDEPIDRPTLVLHKVARADLVLNIEERGTIGSANNALVVCKVRNPERGSATTIKWLVDDGNTVKKGDRLVELDDSSIREQILSKGITVAEKRALHEQAEKDHNLAVQQGKLEVGSAEDNLAIAEIELKQSADKDKAKMEVRLRLAMRAADLAKLQAQTREEKAAGAVVPAEAALDAELARLADLKEQLAACVLTAPSDGIAVYRISESIRGNQGIVAPGEPVRQGQVLMEIPDLSRMQVVVRVHEAMVSRVRASRDGKGADVQSASVVVDAFPDRPLKGFVQVVATVAAPPDFLAPDVKVYLTRIALDANQDIRGLRPGMSAAVAIRVGERKNILRVPVQAVVMQRGNPTCYVKTADGAQQRNLVLGESNDAWTEVKEGLKEGEEVVLNPSALRPARKAPRQEGRLGPLGSADVLVRSVQPPDEGRPWLVARYGLTSADLARIEATVPDLEAVIPVRVFPGPREIRAPRTARNHDARVIATTPGYGWVHGLESELADEDQRFLADRDQESGAAVAVLGAEVARCLFPLQEARGQEIVMSRRRFRVVGVLRPAMADRDNQVYVPLSAARRLFGSRLSQRKPRGASAEEVEFHQLLLVLRDRRKDHEAALTVREMLSVLHSAPDWAVEERPDAP